MLTLSRHTRLAGMSMGFVDDLFLTLTARPSSYLVFGVPCQPRNLAVQRCGSGF